MTQRLTFSGQSQRLLLEFRIFAAKFADYE